MPFPKPHWSWRAIPTRVEPGLELSRHCVRTSRLCSCGLALGRAPATERLSSEARCRLTISTVSSRFLAEQPILANHHLRTNLLLASDGWDAVADGPIRLRRSRRSAADEALLALR